MAKGIGRLPTARGTFGSLPSGPSFKVNISFDGMPELDKDLGNIAGRRLHDLVGPVSEEVGKKLLQDIKNEAPVRSGELQESFELVMGRNDSLFEIISKKVYHGPVNWGWPSRRIKPRRYSRRPIRSAFKGVEKYSEAISKRIGRSR